MFAELALIPRSSDTEMSIDFAIFDDGHHRQLPSLKSGPLKYQTYAFDNFKKSVPFAQGHAMKQAVIAPSMLYLLYPLQGEVEGYPKEKFVEDLVSEVGALVLFYPPRYLPVRVVCERYPWLL